MTDAGHLRRLTRFVTVGATNAAVDLAVFNVLVLAHPTRSPQLLVVYNTLAVVAALTNSYLWNSRWTFRDRTATGSLGRWRQRGLFLIQSALNLVVNDLTIWGMGLLLQPALGVPAAAASNASKVVAMLTASATSYLMMHRMVFVKQH